MISEEYVTELLKNEGRRNAFIDYVRATKYSVDRETIATMLGFELRDEGGEKSAKDNSSISNNKLD